MAFTTTIKSSVNKKLKRLNLRLETLTEEKLEQDRLAKLEEVEYFAQPVFFLADAFRSMESSKLLEELRTYTARFDDFECTADNDVGYTFGNEYFTSPDTEIAYTMIRRLKPKNIVEIGSGHSTKIMRQAVMDGRLNTRVISIDPNPRTEIDKLVDEVYRRPVEALKNLDMFQSLNESDVLFIDSSHIIKAGNDVVFLYLNVIPRLQPGVVIHIHDIFLPYEYPRGWLIEKRWGFNEQYLVHTMLTCGGYEVLWAGCFLQRGQADFPRLFPHLNRRIATSLWLRKAG